MNTRYDQRLPSGVHVRVEVWREGETLYQRVQHHDGKGTPVKNNPSISDAAALVALFERIRKEHPNPSLEFARIDPIKEVDARDEAYRRQWLIEEGWMKRK